MDNDMMYKMFLNTLTKMSDEELENALKKAKGLLNENDYNTLVKMINEKRNIKGNG